MYIYLPKESMYVSGKGVLSLSLAALAIVLQVRLERKVAASAI